MADLIITKIRFTEGKQKRSNFFKKPRECEEKVKNATEILEDS